MEVDPLDRMEAVAEAQEGQPDSSPSSDEMDIDPSTERDLAAAIKALSARLPVARSVAEQRVEEAKAKVDAATSDGAVISAFPRDYQTEVCEFLSGYRSRVEDLAVQRSALGKLEKHKSNKTFPASINSIKVPTIQFMSTFLTAPQEDADRGRFLTLGKRTVGFEAYMGAQISWVKEEILKNWIVEKRREVTFLECKSSAGDAILQFEKAMATKHASLKARYDYLKGQPRYDDLVGDVNLWGVCSHALATSVIGKVHSLVLAEEDRKLAAALAKMNVAQPTVDAAAQAIPNDQIAVLQKKIDDLSKQVTKKNFQVSNTLFSLFCACVGHLSLTPLQLESCASEVIQAGWEAARWEEEREGEERKVRTNQKGKEVKGARR